MSEQIELTAQRFSAPKDLNKLRTAALVAAVVGVLASVLGYFQNATQFFQSYLVAFLFWLSIGLGCLGLLMLQHMTSGRWGLVARRINEAGAATVPFMLILYLPIYLGLEHVFKWARPEAAADPIISAKFWYLNATGFLVRDVLAFVIWAVLAGLLIYYSNQQDRSPDVQQIVRMRQVAAPGILVLALVLSYVSFDWLMSLDPHWYSSIYGAYFLISCGIGGLTFLVLFATFLARREPMNAVLTAGRFHDYGKLMLAFTLVWAYFGVSQLLIIWAANIPEDVLWYIHRTEDPGWKGLSVVLALLHFAVPFLLLLSRARKRNPERLKWVALLLLFMHLVDYFWQAGPNFHHHLTVHWLDFATVVGVGGIWLLLFFTLFQRRPILPINDPYLPEALGHE